jgi:hypothetical protein
LPNDKAFAFLRVVEFSKLGISTRGWGQHQLAQKLTMTILLSRVTSLRFAVFLVRSGNSKSAIGSPIFKAATGLFSPRSSVLSAMQKTANKQRKRTATAVFNIPELPGAAFQWQREIWYFILPRRSSLGLQQVQTASDSFRQLPDSE